MATRLLPAFGSCFLEIDAEVGRLLVDVVTPTDVDRSGHGFGVKIVGGKMVSDKSSEVGAFVTAVQRGGIADQLHGELQEGTRAHRVSRSCSVSFHFIGRIVRTQC